MQKILVAGATGQLGQCVVAELQQRGYAVRALGRAANKLAALKQVETVCVDLTKPETLNQVCANVDAVISCAGAAMNVNNFGDRKSFYAVDYQGNLNLLKAAQQVAVKKFIYVSLAHAAQLRHVEYADAHERFAEQLRASGLPQTIISPTGFFGFLLEILKFASKGRGVQIGDGACRTNPIHEADVAGACVEALSQPDGEMAIGGPDVFTRREISELAFAVLQRPPKLSTVAPGMFKLVISPLKLINPRIHALMDFGGAVTQIDCLAPAYGAQRLRDYFVEAARIL